MSGGAAALSCAVALLLACSAPSDSAEDVVDTPGADTVDAVDTPAVDTPESECLAAPGELTCGDGGVWPSPFVALTDGQEVTMVQGAVGFSFLPIAVLLRNTEQGVRWWRRVTDLQSGAVLHESRELRWLSPLVDGAWVCEGYSGAEAVLALDGVFHRDLQVALCGHEALIDMASEDVQSSPDAPTVYAASSVRVILRPEPSWEITCD